MNQRTLRVFKKYPAGAIGIAVLLFWIFAAIFGPSLLPFTYSGLDTENLIATPGTANHILGTDTLGRDILARILMGSRSILTIALLTSLFSTMAGVLVGFTAGYFGGKLDAIFLRIMDILMAIPPLVLAMVILGILGNSTITSLTIMVSIAYIPATARVARGALLSCKSNSYVAAARIMGESDISIMFIEILPNTIGPIIVEATARFAYSIMMVASLGFLGVGLQPPTPDWGMMVIENKSIMTIAPWTVLYPSIAIASLVISISLISDFIARLIANEP